MQAQGMKRFSFNQISGTTLGIAVLASALIAVGVLRETGNAPFAGDTTGSVSAPPAAINRPSDRGPGVDLNAGQQQSAASAYTSPSMGEGLLDPEMRAMIDADRSAAQGAYPDEGIAPALNTVRPATGAGEGVYPDEGIAPAANTVQPVIKAYTSPGQGEGIIGGFNVYPRAEAVDASWLMFLDQNLHLPTGTLPVAQATVPSTADMKFRDENLYLPTGSDTSQQARRSQGEGFTAGDVSTDTAGTAAEAQPRHRSGGGLTAF